MTGAERSWASHFEVNDVIRYSRGSKIAGIEAGTYGKVIGIIPSPTCSLLRDPPANWPPTIRAADRRQRLPRDRPGILCRRPHPVHRAGQVARRRQSRPCRHRVHRSRWRISARLDNNPQIEFDAKEHRHFDHGYAVTSHSSRASPPSASWSTPIPASTRTCSTPASVTSPSPREP